MKLFKVLTKVKLFISKITSINYYNWHKSLPSLKLGVFSHSHSARLSRTSELNLKSSWSSCSRVAHQTLTHTLGTSTNIASAATVCSLSALVSGCPQKGLITQLRSKEVRRWAGGLFDQRGNKPGKVSSLCQQFRGAGGRGEVMVSSL